VLLVSDLETDLAANHSMLTSVMNLWKWESARIGINLSWDLQEVENPSLPTIWSELILNRAPTWYWWTLVIPTKDFASWLEAITLPIPKIIRSGSIRFT